MKNCFRLFAMLLIVGVLAPAAQAQDFDFGDVPWSNQVARHTAVGPKLGTLRDVDPAHQASAHADGDDLDGTDDEDGVMFLGPFIPGMQTTVRVVVTDAANNSRISGYFDWGGNGHWNHLINELAIHNQQVNEGINDFTVTVPANAAVGYTFVRIKLYNGDSPGTPAGGQRSEGEVEDYRIFVGGPVQTHESTWGRIKALYK